MIVDVANNVRARLRAWANRPPPPLTAARRGAASPGGADFAGQAQEPRTSRGISNLILRSANFLEA
jgi:hypothetical protein